MIKIGKLDEKNMKRYDLLDGLNPVFLDIAVNDEKAFVGFEDWRPEAQSQTAWTFTHDEVHYAISGKAEITYTTPPWHTSDSKKTIIVEKGMTYLIPRGIRWNRKVIGNEPYRHLCVIMPGLPGVDK